MEAVTHQGVKWPVYIGVVVNVLEIGRYTAADADLSDSGWDPVPGADPELGRPDVIGK